MSPHPVTTVYENPIERVLLSPKRDANPFFHLFESLWMLAGRNDATWLDRFVSDFSSRFAEADGYQHGAYGYRWRQHFDLDGGGLEGGGDQLDRAIMLLQANPADRQVVLGMWDPVADLGATVKDRPCNTHAYLRINAGKLDLTVCCRSNDIWWGAYGANAVHFSILQEYLAAKIGVPMGRYYQVSNNFHLYAGVYDKAWAVLDERVNPVPIVEPTPIVEDARYFDSDLAQFFGCIERADARYDGVKLDYANPFFPFVALPLYWAHAAWKKSNDAQLALDIIGVLPQKSDWKLAAKEWIERRQAKRKIKSGVEQVGGDHYKALYQHWDFVRDSGLDYFRGNATKYLTRWRKKGGASDLKKALTYIKKGPKNVVMSFKDTARMENALEHFLAANVLEHPEELIFKHVIYGDLDQAEKMLEEFIPEAEKSFIIHINGSKPVPLTEENHHAERASS